MSHRSGTITGDSDQDSNAITDDEDSGVEPLPTPDHRDVLDDGSTCSNTRPGRHRVHDQSIECRTTRADDDVVQPRSDQTNRADGDSDE